MDYFLHQTAFAFPHVTVLRPGIHESVFQSFRPLLFLWPVVELVVSCFLLSVFSTQSCGEPPGLLYPEVHLIAGFKKINDLIISHSELPSD
jgi:hypothetical protein